jgi:tetratricopeptide (TPR) repeat protein
VNNNELYLQYRQAIQLIRVGRYEESMHILQEIDGERPETKNVLYAMAVCCEMLGKTDEALDMCERLIARYEHPKARIIKARIEKAASEPELPTVDLLADLGLGKVPAASSPTPAPAAQEAAEEDIPLALPASDSDPKEKPAKKGWLFRFSKKS